MENIFDTIQEVIDSAQILYTKKDVVELLEKQREQMIEKACELYCSLCLKRCVCIELYGYQHDKCIPYQTFKQSMKG